MSGSEKNQNNAPATWEDEETMNACFHEYFQDHLYEYPDAIKEAFRIGWKAGAGQATINMWHWINETVFGHVRLERNKNDESADVRLPVSDN